ncbi:MAG: type II toxin-antitoxin system RelE/ParE family toxin [Candidatus Paralactobacillus gallistercoris]|uniref:Type II toxin-antitoxin system RelE/ParE family toxin n=1 Tax=Candidatus Paralactobacillus gallistercoris TaxID=2838724 RepID=A0A948TIA5_9LACO|nr:type II toxin-antitoxin system RelE/ParE family toxin [Candidatus Paralactobacillus gallistercoris]
MAIFVYEDKRAKIPFYEWRNKMNAKEPSIAHKIDDMIAMMQNKTLPLERPRVKRMLARLPYRDLFKIRLGKYRLFFLFKDDDYYLLHAFRKSSQRTPEKECRLVAREIEANHYTTYHEQKGD